jgi:hypothetical protein
MDNSLILKWLNGDGYGDGYGDGSGFILRKHNSSFVHYIDKAATVITKIRQNVARGYIIGDDMQLSPCFIAKNDHGIFAHGKTAKEAVQALADKIFAQLNITEKITQFKKLFVADRKYPVSYFYNWHYILTGSCEYGRAEFCRNRGIDVKKDELTPQEFLTLSKGQYGWERFSELEKHYKTK